MLKIVGKWEISQSRFITLIHDSNLNTICLIKRRNEKVIADMRLIASAPEMYDFLRKYRKISARAAEILAKIEKE